jgi:FkbM family methyltransferase
MFKKFIKSIFRHFGLSINTLETIRYLESKDRLPPANIDGITFLLTCLFYANKASGLNFLQVGACDGKAGDPIFDYAQKGVMNCFLMEPVPSTFKKLQENYEGVANATLLNCALGEKDQIRKIYTIEGLEACQGASFDHSFVEKWGNDFKKNAVIRGIDVEVLSYATLMKKLKITQFHIVQIDAEGYDDEIVKMILKCKSQLPLFLNFESLHIPKSRANAFFSELDKQYFYFHDNWNTLAIRKNLFQSHTFPKTQKNG